LLYNAIKYNKKEGTIDIIYKEGYLEIKDTWIGIKSENLNKIFDRFYKVDTSRSTEGFGIGLALVKQIANVYTWKINVESVEWEGTSFKVKF
jgi:two-component system OmpR family sensor kinase